MQGTPPPLLGTPERPATVRVQTTERAERVLELCGEADILVMIQVEPRLPEDLGDLEQALLAREPPPRELPASDVTPPRRNVGRNDLCSCGSGKKHKKCCAT